MVGFSSASLFPTWKGEEVTRMEPNARITQGAGIEHVWVSAQPPYSSHGKGRKSPGWNPTDDRLPNARITQGAGIEHVRIPDTFTYKYDRIADPLVSLQMNPNSHHSSYFI